jgi:hypothetical protein
MLDDESLERLSTQIAEKLRREPGRAQKRLLSVEEAAIYIGRSVGAVEQFIKRGTVPVTQIDGKRQLDLLALDRIIKDSTYYAA